MHPLKLTEEDISVLHVFLQKSELKEVKNVTSQFILTFSLQIFNRMRTNSGLSWNGFRYVLLSLDVSCTKIFFTLETLPMQVFEAHTKDYHKQPFRRTYQKDDMVLVIPISLTGQAGKCLNQTAEHKEVLFSQKRMLSRMYRCNTNADVALRQSCCVTQASIKQRIGTSRRVSLNSRFPPHPATFSSVPSSSIS